MKAGKVFALSVSGVLLVGCLAGCSTVTESQGGSTSRIEINSQQTVNVSGSPYSVTAEGNGTGSDISYEERFKPYEPFGLTYDTDQNELQYHGKAVRWFEDYYAIEDDAWAGMDFFNENGVVDVYAVRDFSNLARADDGSFDPGGTLIGVKEFSAEAFAARDIEAIKNPPLAVSMAGDPPSAKELKEMAEEYEAFGVTYDIEKDQWYYNGEIVRYFLDILISNGESLTGGRFNGTIRNSWNTNGTVDLYTVRDFANLNDDGYGTLTGIEACSQAEFDERTQSLAELYEHP